MTYRKSMLMIIHGVVAPIKNLFVQVSFLKIKLFKYTKCSKITQKIVFKCY